MVVVVVVVVVCVCVCEWKRFIQSPWSPMLGVYHGYLGYKTLSMMQLGILSKLLVETRLRLKE